MRGRHALVPTRPGGRTASPPGRTPSGASARMVRRRTFVLRRERAGWRISHLHASDLAVAPTRPTP